MNDCEQFKIGTRKWQICTGQANLPEESINAYRKSWGLEPLTEFPDIDRKPYIFKNAQNKDAPPISSGFKTTCNTCSKPKVQTNSVGPGTKLKLIFQDKGVPSCSNCNRLATLMDEWGIEGCKKNYDYIVEDIFPRAKAWFSTNKPWIHALLPNVVEDAGIRVAIKSYLDSVLK